MTAVETESKKAAQDAAPQKPALRKYLAFGTGVAIEVNGGDLDVLILRVRPNGPRVLRRESIRGFRERPAAEWAREFEAIAKGHDTAGVTVLLPRRDVIVRHVQLPGVSRNELAGALALRLRGLHPFAEDDVAWCWCPVENGALAGLMRLTILGRYESLFSEAGIPVASFTFSASVVHAALRVLGEPAVPFLGLTETGAGVLEAYGENAAGMIFSGEFTGPAERAAAVGMAELRLPVMVEPVGLGQLLPRRDEREPVIDRPLLYAGAMAAACPWTVKTANFLPTERRAGQSRIWLIPTAVLTVLLIVCLVGLVAAGPWRERQYMAALKTEIAKVEPQARRAGTIDQQVAHARAEIQTLDSFKARSQGDFDVLNELTRLIAPPGWTTTVEIFPDYVIVAGEAEQAASLVKILDSSPQFQNSEFTNSVSRGADGMEQFRIKTFRRKR